jgi:hypothetical protein
MSRLASPRVLLASPFLHPPPNPARTQLTLRFIQIVPLIADIPNITDNRKIRNRKINGNRTPEIYQNRSDYNTRHDKKSRINRRDQTNEIWETSTELLTNTRSLIVIASNIARNDSTAAYSLRTVIYFNYSSSNQIQKSQASWQEYSLWRLLGSTGVRCVNTDPVQTINLHCCPRITIVTLYCCVRFPFPPLNSERISTIVG